jgi:uncharacterized membrane protein YhaH (DUF805 family)
MKWYFQVLRKYAVFRGRAGRKEWWMFFLIYVAVVFGLKGIDILLGTFDWDRRYNVLINVLSDFGTISGLYLIGTIIPVVAVTVRRLHDTNRSGWWYLIIFIPVFGGFQQLIWMAQRSQPGENRYGLPPQDATQNRPILDADL